MGAFSYHLRRWNRSGQAGARLAACWLLIAMFAGATPCLGQAADDSAGTSRAKESGRSPVYIADVQAGFAGSGQNLARADYFAPVRVTLVNRTGEIFTGTVQIIGYDRDRETVIYERPGIGIKPSDSTDIVMSWFARDSTGATNGTQMTVRLLDKDGKFVHSLDVPVEFSPDNEYLIVDISSKPIKGLIQTVLMDSPDLWYRGRVRTGYLRAADVPTSWHELEAVDVIVCDQPDDARLGTDQVNALMQWVRQGGLLVLGPGSLQSLNQTDLAKELPATAETMARISRADFLNANSAAASTPPAGRTAEDAADAEADPPAWRVSQDDPKAVGPGLSYLTFNWLNDIGVWQLKPRADATTLLELPLKRGTWPVIVRRRLGAGSIVQSAISLSFLLSNQVKEGRTHSMGSRVRPEIFGIRTLDTKEKLASRVDMNWTTLWPNQYGPRDLIKGQADFRAAGTILATVLMLLTIVYGLAVTVGTWLVLRRRQLTQYSWLIFGAAAVAGSIGAGFLVQSARGIRAEVKQESVIDLDAASGMASVHTFYGLRMPYDARVDVGLTAHRDEELPPEQAKEAYIRPAADLSAGMAESFAVRRDYTIRYGQQSLEDVPIRATAKQFESYWYGPLGGSIQGTIVLENNGQQLSNRSWLANQTDMPLRECILVFSSKPTFSLARIRGEFITVMRIGQLPPGKVRSDLSAILDRTPSPGMVGGDYALDKVGKDWLTKMPWNVIGQQRGYRSAMAEVEPIDRTDSTQALAATMVTLLSDLPSVDQASWSNNQLVPFLQFPRSGGRWLDMRYVLDGKTAIVIGLTDKPGPTRLKVNGRAVEPSSGGCIVRAVVPLVGAGD